MDVGPFKTGNGACNPPPHQRRIGVLVQSRGEGGASEILYTQFVWGREVIHRAGKWGTNIVLTHFRTANSLPFF